MGNNHAKVSTDKLQELIADLNKALDDAELASKTEHKGYPWAYGSLAGAMGAAVYRLQILIDSAQRQQAKKEVHEATEQLQKDIESWREETK